MQSSSENPRTVMLPLEIRQRKVTKRLLLLALSCYGGLRVVPMSTCVALADSCCLTAKATQIIQFRTSNTTLLHKVDMIDDGCVKRENSFDSNTEARFSHSYSFARATMFAGNHNPLKRLQS